MRISNGIVGGCVFLGLFFSTGLLFAQDTLEGELERLDTLVRNAPDGVIKMGAAYAREELRNYVPLEDFLASTEALAEEKDREEPLLGFLLRRQATRVAMELGRHGDGESLNRSFPRNEGCLVDWSLVGPFENGSMQGFYEPLGPEEGSEGPFEGRLTEVDWRELREADYLCTHFLNSRVHPSTSAVVYLATTLELEAPTQARLLLGSRSAYRIWINGEPLGQREGSELGLGLDAEGYDISLRGGENEILLKLGSTGQGGLGFVARIVDQENRPLPDINARHGVTPRSLKAFTGEEMEPTRGLRPLVRAGVEAQDPSTRLWSAYLTRQLYSEDASTPWRNTAEALREEGFQGIQGRDLIILASLFEEHWQRQAILDSAVESQGEDLYLQWARAEERSQGITHLEWDRQYGELRALVALAPQFLRPREGLATWYEKHEGGARALLTFLDFDNPNREKILSWNRGTADLLERFGDRQEAARLREAMASRQQVTGTFGWQLMREEIARQEPEAALARVMLYQQRAPWNRSWPLQEVMLRRAMGDMAGALARIDDLIEENPGDANLRERRAALAIASGDLEGAMASLEDAIALRPQATYLQEYLDHLRPDSDRFYEPWIVRDLRQIAAESEPGPHHFDHIVEQRVHQVASNGLARQFVQRAQRVLRDEGIANGRFLQVTHRQGDERVEVIGVRVHKPDGQVVEDYRQWRSGDTQKRTTTYNDSVHVNLRANNVEVGDIVEFLYVIHQVANENFRGDYFGSVAYLQRGQPIALSRYVVIYPENWNLYFREPALPHRRWENARADGTAVEGKRVTGFELRDLPRVFTEEDQPGFSDVYDHIIVSNKSSYDEIGRWWWNLIEEQLVVDDSIRAQVRELTGGLPNEAAKVEAIYDFVARNTRYLHVGLGIHGWKPYRTSTILRNRYGDCKDKSALLKVMLEEAGIEAHLALVRTRRLGSIGDFPASMHVFNHAVTYVPSMDLFLDATAEFNGPYELTSMNHGAQALIVRDGGETSWVTMPIDEPDQNLMRQELEFDLDGEVPLLSGRIVAYGSRAVQLRRSLEDPERRDERFERQLGVTFPGIRLIDATYEDLDNLHAPTVIHFTAEVPGVLRDGSDGKSFQTLASPQNLLGRYARESSRHQDRTFRVPFAQEMNVRYRLPANTSLERIPEARRVESPFGEMHVTYERFGAELVVDVRYTIGMQRIPVSEYGEFRAFVSKMHEALNETIRLVDEGGR